ncbi:unnamed protein product [Tuber aestivum]|uniref:ASX DEUBAD domain-containing protein n=1 Tax=Tuber aestivum TaxID=59557 RepID=A0A292PQD8_9PEZI|nr:unnamed protein product [Tuber aestivum]
MDSMSRRSSSRIATKKSLAAVGAERLTTANQDPSTVPNPEPAPSSSPRVQGGNKRKAVSVSSPTASHGKKLRRAIADTAESKDVAVDASEVVVVDAPEIVAADASEVVAPPANNASDAEPERTTERQITPSCQEHLEKPWVPPVIERRNPLVSRFESLVTPENFGLLTNEQKSKLYTLLPGFDKEIDDSKSGHPNGTLDLDILPPFWNDTRFRTQLSTIGERLEQGKYSQKFRDQIDSIMRRRADDEFRFMKDRAMESFWGQKKEVINPALAGQAASIKLTTMARHHVIRVNDTLCLKRQFAGYSLIEKHAIVTAIDQATGVMQLSYPPAQMRRPVAGVEDKTMHDVHSPGQIERILLEENGTGPDKPPNGNSFKNIFVLRGGNELGSLFFLRAQFFLVYLPPIEGGGPSVEGKKAAASHSRKAPESSRLAQSTKSESPLNETHPGGEHITKKVPEGEEEKVKKSLIRNCSPAMEPSRSNHRSPLSKAAKNVSPVDETRPGDGHDIKKGPEEQKAPVTRKRRAMRKR